MTYYYSRLNNSGQDYKKVVDELIEAGLPYSRMINYLQFMNKSKCDIFKYFYENYMCKGCKDSCGPEILDVLASFPPSECINGRNLKVDNAVYSDFLEYLFDKNDVYPEQFGKKCQFCVCSCSEEHCHTSANCKCIYECSETSFYHAIRNKNYIFLEIGLRYTKDKLPLFCTNETVLKRYIRFSDEKTAKMLYAFYQKNNNSVSYTDFKNGNLKAHCVAKPTNQAILDKLEDLQYELQQLKNTITG